MNSTIDALQKRIAVLERKTVREKKARNLAEIQLERYSSDIYEANQSLKAALTSSTEKQLELEYLAKASSNVASEASLNEMISDMIKLTGNFCCSDYGFFIVSEHGVELPDNAHPVWGKNQGWHESNELKSLIVNTLPLSELNILDDWENLSIESNNNSYDEAFNLILYTNFALSTDKIGWLIFLNNQKQYDKERLSVLTTSRDHLLGGIQRRLTDLRILKRNAQLQDSLSKLKKTRHQLIQSEKMASLGQLAAGVAHEINNPIAFIRSNMEVLKDYLNDYKLVNVAMKSNIAENDVLDATAFKDITHKFDLSYIEEDSEDLLQSNIEGLDRVKEIVDNLKSFSHSGDEVLVEISLSECVSSALQVVSNVFKYEHIVENNMPTTCPFILGNAGQLQQVFVNLFVNAAYAMQGGGQLTISSSQNNEELIVYVKDTGSGMDIETVSQLFTPFFTTKPVGTGTGLGLSISYSILEAHGAKISVDSELNVGTTFSLCFPIIN